ncbi:D-alanyl-D-alanine carboxypeptidase (penicillin-binding protein 5/6) [Rhizomicrobium palustre]|uniref:serine-type D-Ala-D-Ala carboxypeptidase n=1 Tax=Rhizomicrobium palustre TaxID=189966 RepID=A0A846N402_9PROT|nr:D-alanyl-D-alanine carboxypeptidase family protein [Rhizomicrobium palustre]NIK89961.1 D-alanyl-D-alanine carboxypeptidase (penicillin-binding protein 5/6) [Rhizomicrobium palustre]
MPRLRVLSAVLPLALLAAVPAKAAMNTTAEHAVLMDAETGQVLWAKDGYAQMAPASMSKLMTIELLFQRLKDGRVKLTDTFAVSERAWRTGGSKGFVRVGDRLTVEDLINRIIVVSGNDACVVVAEALGGSQEGFVDMMNKRAKEIGLTGSHFVNPDGLPEPAGQLMTAYDLAKLARHLIKDYPAYYHFFSVRSYTTSDQGKSITQPNRNMVLDKFPGADGLKTGHTDLAGYGVTASAVKDGHRLILVLNGLRYPDLDKAGPAKADWFAEIRRGEEAARVLDMGFREFRSYPLFKAGEVAGTVPVFGGAAQTVPVTAKVPVNVTMQVDSRQAMKVALKYKGPVAAPVKAGDQVGTLTVTAPDFPGLTVPVYATQDVGRQNIFIRMFTGIKALLGGKK